MKYKKATHVGITLSFAIFITFLFLTFTIIQNPFKSESLERSLLNVAEENLKKELSAEIIRIGVLRRAEASNPKQYTKVDDTDFNLEALEFVVLDESENSLPAKRDGELYFEWNTEVQDRTFIIHYAESGVFNLNLIPGNVPPSQVKIADIKTVKKTKEIIFTKIETLITEDYVNFYDDLKATLGIPLNDEFAIQFEYNHDGDDQTLGEGTDLEKNRNIYVEEFAIDYLDDEGQRRMGTFIIYVW